MNRNTELGIAGILIVLISVFAIAIVGSPLISNVSNAPHPTLAIQPTPTNAEENAIQLKPFIPPSVVSTATPPVTYNSDIPFSDPGLDWDDVQPLLAKCSNVSSSCQQEAIEGVHTELGDVDLSSSQPGFKTGSRVYICYHDPTQNCRFNGFKAYNQSPPLPAFNPSQDCISQFNACLQSEVPQLHQTCPEIFDTNCDASDTICSFTSDKCTSE